MSDLPFKIGVNHDGEIINYANGGHEYVPTSDVDRALNDLPLLLSIAEAAEKYRDAENGAYHSRRQYNDAMIPYDMVHKAEQGAEIAQQALDTALAAWRAEGGKR